MRPRNNLSGSYRTRERGFYTESEFLKFAQIRSQDNRTSLVRTIPDVFVETASVDFQPVEEREPPSKAKSASA